jgi:hypothetical protein
MQKLKYSFQKNVLFWSRAPNASRHTNPLFVSEAPQFDENLYDYTAARGRPPIPMLPILHNGPTRDTHS